MTRLPLLLAGLLAVGCSGGSSSSSGGAASTAPGTTSPAPAPTPAPAPPAHTAWTLHAGDFHVHTNHSGDGHDSVAQTAALARHMGLDFVVLSDHSTLSQTRDPDFVSTPDLTLVEGLEWTDHAHAGLVGVSAVPPKLSGFPAGSWPTLVHDMLGNTQAQGGVAILYHPAWNHHPWIIDVQGADAVEVWNNLWMGSDTGLHPTTQQDVDNGLQSSGMAAAGVLAGPATQAMLTVPGGGNDRALRYWEALLDRGERVAAVGGSDRHKLLPPGYPTTWVLAPGKSEAEVLEAVRAGRTLITQGPEGPRVTFEADGDGDGVFESTLGDDVPPSAAMGFRIRVEGAAGGKLRLVHGRAVVQEVPILAADHTVVLTHAVQAGDWLRVDVFLPVDWSLPGANLAVGTLPFGSSTTAVHTALTAWGVSLTLGTNYPVIELDERYRRILNLDPNDVRWSRAAITSPIYVR